MIITCPRCGLVFETQATTNTRCRRCKSVVRIGSGPAHKVRPAGEPAPDEPSDELANGGLLVVAAGVVILVFYVAPVIVRFVRSRRAAEGAPTSGTVGQVGVTPPSPAPPGHTSETGARTGPTEGQHTEVIEAL